MKLLIIRVQNHARLQDCDLAVRDHLVLVGANDVGKSSLLRCLDLLLGSSTAQLYARVTPDDVRAQAVPFMVEATLTDLSLDEEAAFPDEIVVDPVTGGKSLTVRLEVTVDETGAVQISRTAPRGGTGRQLSRHQLSHLGWRMISATQGGARDFRDERNSSLDDILSSIELGDERPGFEAVIAQFQGRLDGSAVLEQLRKQLATQLSRAFPERLETGDLALVPGAIATEDVLTDVRLQVVRQGEHRSLTQQSDGTRALFAMALYDLVSESANIVAIDEPEIHLHPTSQRSLGRMLRKGENQKVIATHSPDIVGTFRPDQIVSLQPGGRLVQPEPDFLTNEDRLIAHWWVRDRLEPLTARRVVVVEGASDRIVLRRITELHDCELDRLGISVVELDGAGGVGFVRSLFGDNGFQVPLHFLIDQDAAAKTAAQFGVDEADLQAQNVFVCRRDLEDEYVRAIGPQATWDAIVSSQLFSPNELANCEPSGPDGTYTQEDVAGFCRKKGRGYKMRAAIAVTKLLDTETAAAITPVVSLLKSITPQVADDHAND